MNRSASKNVKDKALNTLTALLVSGPSKEVSTKTAPSTLVNKNGKAQAHCAGLALKPASGLRLQFGTLGACRDTLAAS